MKLVELNGQKFWEAENTKNKYSLQRYITSNDAQKAEDSNIDCRNCMNCHDCTNCSFCVECSYCVNCYSCNHCFTCTGCNDCAYCAHTRDSEMSALLLNADKHLKCFFASNLVEVFNILHHKHLMSGTEREAFVTILDKARFVIEDYNDKLLTACQIEGVNELIFPDEEDWEDDWDDDDYDDDDYDDDDDDYDDDDDWDDDEEEEEEEGKDN